MQPKWRPLAGEWGSNLRIVMLEGVERPEMSG
jgi:hypothetical protein